MPFVPKVAGNNTYFLVGYKGDELKILLIPTAVWANVHTFK